MRLEMSALGMSALGMSALEMPALEMPALGGMPALGMPALGATRWCSACAGERAFETPPCQDDHGDDCLDLACVECGHAIVVGLQAASDVSVVEFAAA